MDRRRDWNASIYCETFWGWPWGYKSTNKIKNSVSSLWAFSFFVGLCRMYCSTDLFFYVSCRCATKIPNYILKTKFYIIKLCFQYFRHFGQFRALDFPRFLAYAQKSQNVNFVTKYEYIQGVITPTCWPPGQP